MSGNMTLEETFEASMKSYEHLDKKNEYLKKQIRESLKNNRRVFHSDVAGSSGPSSKESES